MPPACQASYKSVHQHKKAPAALVSVSALTETLLPTLDCRRFYDGFLQAMADVVDFLREEVVEHGANDDDHPDLPE